jgi:hypothetical protein
MFRNKHGTLLTYEVASIRLIIEKCACGYVEIKCQLDATYVFFIADLIACSTCFGHHYARHQERKSIIQVVAACGICCFGFQVVGLV